MNYDNTDLHFLHRHCIKRFGAEEGEKIYLRASKLYAELVVTTDYQNSAEAERQLKMLIFPVIAYYKTLRAFGYAEDSALEYVRLETEKAAKHCADVLADQKRKLFPFHAFKRNIKKFMASKFPAPACKYADLCVRGKKISFQIKQCIYRGISIKFGCPELCTVFCEYERIAFAGLGPHIVSERGETLPEGHDRCEFAFVKGANKSL